MSDGRENGARSDVPRPKKYYWPWECNYPRFRFSLLALILFVAAAAFGSCCIGRLVRSVEGKNLSAAEANRRLKYVDSYCEVPDGAMDVDLRASYMGTTMSFDMPFSEFAAYCSHRGWDLRQINPNWPEHTHDIDYKPLVITNGYYYRNLAPRGSGYQVYYDMGTRRAWIDYSSR